MGADPAFLQSMRKGSATTSFALWVRNLIPRPVELKVQLGSIEGMPRLDASAYTALIAANRERYCVMPEVKEFDISQFLVTDATKGRTTPPPLPDQFPVPEPKPRDHLAMQAKIRSLAQRHGFHVTIEKPLGDGRRVDVSLERADLSIACEISATTKAAHEVENLKKCFEAGYTQVWSIAATAEQVKAVEVLAEQVLPREWFAQVSFVMFAEIEELIGALPAAPVSSTVLGYDVAVQSVAVSERVREQKWRRLGELVGVEVVAD